MYYFPSLFTQLHKDAWRSGGMAPSILNLSNRQRWGVTCAPVRFSNSEKKNPCKKLGGPLAGVEAGVKLNYLSTLGIKPQFLGNPAWNLLSILTVTPLPCWFSVWQPRNLKS